MALVPFTHPVVRAPNCRVRQEKEQFYAGQGKTAGGFMRMASTTLHLLLELAANSALRHTFLQEPILTRAAFAALHFLELLVGPKAVGLQVRPLPGGYISECQELPLDQERGQLPVSRIAHPGYKSTQSDQRINGINKLHPMLRSVCTSGANRVFAAWQQAAQHCCAQVDALRTVLADSAPLVCR